MENGGPRFLARTSGKLSLPPGKSSLPAGTLSLSRGGLNVEPGNKARTCAPARGEVASAKAPWRFSMLPGGTARRRRGSRDELGRVLIGALSREPGSTYNRPCSVHIVGEGLAPSRVGGKARFSLSLVFQNTDSGEWMLLDVHSDSKPPPAREGASPSPTFKLCGRRALGIPMQMLA